MIKIQFEKTPPNYRPGDSISGFVAYQSNNPPPERLEARLIWYTQGKGDQDVDLVSSEFYELTESDKSVLNGQGIVFDFKFPAPSRPYSFSGKLISLEWAIEVIEHPSGKGIQSPLTISPTSHEIVLDRMFDKALITKPWFRKTR